MDQITQSTSLIDLVQGLYGPIEEAGNGVLPVALDFVTVWVRDDFEKQETGNARLGVIAPDGTLINQFVNYDVDLKTASQARNVTKFPGFPFKGSGKHLIVIESEGPEDTWTRQCEWPVVIGSLASAPFRPV